MKKVIYIILVLILVLLLGINILSITNNSFFGYRIFRVASGSMEPTIKINSLILVKNKDNYKVSDIVTYKEDDNYITHRIISMDEEFLITKGDANNIEDNPIKKEEIIGKLVYSFKINNFISYLLSNPITWILIFIIGLTLIFIIPTKKE